jgi:hypothetical protein
MLVVLVTLGGCHLLDGLVVCLLHEARKKIVRCSEEVIVRGIVRPNHMLELGVSTPRGRV